MQYEQVLIYSFIENRANPGRHIGWTASMVLDFSKPGAEITDQGEGQSSEKPRPPNAKKKG
jgi:hypothetical protein